MLCDQLETSTYEFWNRVYLPLLCSWIFRRDFYNCKFCCPELIAAVLKLANMFFFFFFSLLRLRLTYNYFCYCVCFAASVLHDTYFISSCLCGMFPFSILQILPAGLWDSCFCWTLLAHFNAFTTVCFHL